MPIYICKEESSNKFWSYETTGLNVNIKWGRLGLKGQEQTKSFPSNYEVDRFVSKKVSEKLDGGYQEVTPEEYEVQAAIGATIGVAHKLDKMEFVIEEHGYLKKLTPKELHQPNTKPLVYAKLVGRRASKEDIAPYTELLMDVNSAYTVRTNHGAGGFVQEKTPIKAGDDCEALVSAVGQCIGKILL